MSITLYEEVISRGFANDRERGGEVTLNYFIVISTDAEDNPVAVDAAIRLDMPLLYAGLWLLGWKADPVGPRLWKAAVRYGPRDGEKADPDNPSENPTGPDADTPLTPEWEFDTTGQTYRITQSLSTLIKAGPGGDGLDYTNPADTGVNDPDAPDYGKAIGVTRDGVEGVDIPPRGPIHVVTTRILPARAVTMGYIDTLASLTNRTNDTPWWGRAEGEWIFLGARGKTKSATEWTVTYLFDAGKIERDISIGSFTVAAKAPFDFLWVAYGDSTSAGRKVKTPQFAYVERVVGSISFASLGIT